MSNNVKLIFDSDALIKLVKTGFPSHAFDKLKVVISEEIFRETVTEGKKKFYQDAESIELLINGKKIIIGERGHGPERRLPKEDKLGKGEKSALSLFYGIKADAIVSDDKAFLQFLKQANVPFLMPADLISSLNKKKILDKNEALRVLDGLKPFIKDECYSEIKNNLEGKK